MVATAVIMAVDKAAERSVRRLKVGQKLRFYVEAANKEYGTKGSDAFGYYRGSSDAQSAGTKIKVFDIESGKEVSIVARDCLLEVYEEFDPQSNAGKKLSDCPKKRGRKAKAAADEEAGWAVDPLAPLIAEYSEFERELDNEEYTFENTNEYDYYNE